MRDPLLAHVEARVAEDPACLTDEVRTILLDLRRLRIYEVQQIERLLGLKRARFGHEIGDNDLDTATKVSRENGRP